MKMYFAGNLPQSSKVESEKEMAEKMLRKGHGYNRLVSFYYSAANKSKSPFAENVIQALNEVPVDEIMQEEETKRNWEARAAEARQHQQERERQQKEREARRDPKNRENENKEYKLSLIVGDIKELCNNDKLNAYEKGRLLTEAKKLVGHGNFRKFIKDNFGFGYQTANNLMKIYRCCLGRPEIAKSIKSSVLYKIGTNNFPEDLREHLFENHYRLENISNKTIQEIGQRFKNNEIGFDSPEIRDLIKYNENCDEYADHLQKLEQCFRSYESLVEKITSLAAKMPKWPEAISPSESVLGLTKDQEWRMERIYTDLQSVIDTTKPRAYVVIEEGMEPKVGEPWVHPRRIKRDNVDKDKIKSCTKDAHLSAMIQLQKNRHKIAVSGKIKRESIFNNDYRKSLRIPRFNPEKSKI